MTRTLIPIASLAAVIAGVGFVATDHALAAEPRTAGMQVISSDATARYAPLQVSKAVVIDLAADVKSVLVSDPKIANAFIQTQRRVYIVAFTVGATNIYFFDVHGRQIDALDVNVTARAQPFPPPIWRKPTEVRKMVTVWVYLGPNNVAPLSLSCSRTGCSGGPETPVPAVSYSDQTIHNLDH